MIKNIIFDVGDVLLEYRWKDMLMDYGLTYEEAVRVGTQMFENKLWGEGLDLGIMTQEEVIAEYKRQYPEDAEIIEWFISNGQLMRVNRPEVWKKVRDLKARGFRIYLLSNYSRELFEKHTEGADFLKVIDGKVVSYMIHRIKPDMAIYHYLLDTYSLNPKECLFFDDRLENVQAARTIGIEGIHVTSREMLNEKLEALLKTEFPKKK